MRQSDLFAGHPSSAPRSEHGGDVRKGRRKLARPIDPRRAMHLVLRADLSNVSGSMLGHARANKIRELINREAIRRRIRVYRYANAGNHLHLVVKAATRRDFQAFLRTVAGLIARLVTGARKGCSSGSKFWAKLAYTRVVEWGKQFRFARDYVVLNEMEAQGAWRREWRRAWMDRPG